MAPCAPLTDHAGRRWGAARMAHPTANCSGRRHNVLVFAPYIVFSRTQLGGPGRLTPPGIKCLRAVALASWRQARAIAPGFLRRRRLDSPCGSLSHSSPEAGVIVPFMGLSARGSGRWGRGSETTDRPDRCRAISGRREKVGRRRLNGAADQEAGI